MSGSPRDPSCRHPLEFATSLLQEPFEQGLEYVIPLEGLDYQEDTRAENPVPDGKGGVNMDDLQMDSQENEKTQAVITLEEPHGQEARRVEDPDRRERQGENIQELHAPQPPPPKAILQEPSDWSREEANPRG